MGAYLLIFIAGFVLIAWWSWRNDAVPLDGQTRGLFRMRQPNLAGSDDLGPEAAERNG